MVSLTVREITPSDYPLLAEFLYQAIFIPVGMEAPPHTIIDHPDGCQSVYSGLNSAVPISAGDRVIGKQAIGKVDSVPCEISDESHMHFAMKREGKWIDPAEVIN